MSITAATHTTAAAALAEIATAWNAWFDGALNASNATGVYGPYLIVAASPSAATSMLSSFAHTPIPNLDPDMSLVDTGRWSLLVLPVCVYRRAASTARGLRREFLVNTYWASEPSPTMPTDADLGVVLVRAMSVQADGPPTLGPGNVWVLNPGWEPGALGAAVAAAVEMIGWRATAEVTIAACGNRLVDPAEVTAVLTALISSPRRGS